MTGNRLKITPINVALVVLMLIQLGAIALLYWPSAEATDSAPLLGELSAEDINELVVSTDSENALRLVQTGSGWVLADRDNFPANPTKVEEIVDKLVAMETNRLVTQTDASHNRLQVAADNFAGKIDITNLQAEKGFTGLMTYSHSKRIMETMSLVLANEMEPRGIYVNVIYPGSASTSMTQNVTFSSLPWFARPLFPLFWFIGISCG